MSDWPMAEIRKQLVREQTRKRTAKYRANLTADERKECKTKNLEANRNRVIDENEILRLALQQRERVSKWSLERKAEESRKRNERDRDHRSMMRKLKNTDYPTWHQKHYFAEQRTQRIFNLNSSVLHS
jgi:hypothetical protein